MPPCRHPGCHPLSAASHRRACASPVASFAAGVAVWNGANASRLSPLDPLREPCPEGAVAIAQENPDIAFARDQVGIPSPLVSCHSGRQAVIPDVVVAGEEGERGRVGRAGGSHNHREVNRQDYFPFHGATPCPAWKTGIPLPKNLRSSSDHLAYGVHRGLFQREYSASPRVNPCDHHIYLSSVKTTSSRCDCSSAHLNAEMRTESATRHRVQPAVDNYSLRRLVQVAKARWKIEQDYHQLKEELGLDHSRGPQLERVASPRDAGYAGP